MNTTEDASSGQTDAELLLRDLPIPLVRYGQSLLVQSERCMHLRQAQKRLENAGWSLHDSVVHVGALYIATFVSSDSKRSVSLRYSTHRRGHWPPLILMYRNDGVWKRFGRDLPTSVFDPNCHNAQYRLLHLQGTHPDKESKWFPFFDCQ